MRIKKFVLEVIVSLFVASAISNQLDSPYELKLHKYHTVGKSVGLFSSVYAHKAEYEKVQECNYKSFIHTFMVPFFKVEFIDKAINELPNSRVDMIRIEHPFGIHFIHRETGYIPSLFSRADKTLAREEVEYSKFFEAPAQ